jgi:hypothetical protein
MESWKGIWRNQYGSTLVIDDDADGAIRGRFRTVLEDSSFFGFEVPVYGAAHGDVIGFVFAAQGKSGPAAAGFTGLWRDGKLEMLWHTVAGHALTASKEGEPARIAEVGKWRAFGTSLDVFERAD